MKEEGRRFLHDQVLVLHGVKFKFEYHGLQVKRACFLGFSAGRNDLALQQAFGNYGMLLLPGGTSQPEPISKGAPEGDKREVGLELPGHLILPAAAERPSFSPVGAPVTKPADAPFIEQDGDNPMNWSLVLRWKWRSASRLRRSSKEMLAAASCGGQPPGSEATCSDQVRRGILPFDRQIQY
ncbi:hypothetical protein HPB51_023816 [Rhipicephalus microplus]|uniref:Uncharacterized protein n=1 Tax=Rhipicephalus microplus TaxID=6941 RepID=A0A9J6E570_RHIMP|nr:hypothetical protein HPB51_023816 [Rhipicephalus microplus]